MSSRISISQVHKSFRTPVLRGVDLDLQAGEIHGLVGENGAGKSTLMNIICGIVPSDSGEMLLDGELFQPANSRHAFNSGVTLAAQELSLIDTLSIAENISLRKLPQTRLLIQRKLVLETFHYYMDLLQIGDHKPETAVGKLSLGEKQLVELAKALSANSRLLILDEPTSALTESQSDILHKIIRQLADEGTSVIYISHRLNDVLNISDRVSVMRDGDIVNTSAAQTFSANNLIELMSGTENTETLRSYRIQPSNSPLLRVNNLTTSKLKHSVSFECYRGEILGIAGLAGSGQSELLKSIFGLAKSTSGDIQVHTGDKWQSINKPRDALALKIAYLAEDRKTAGIFSGQDVNLNMTLPGLRSYANKWGIIQRRALSQSVKKYLEKLEIKCHGPEQNVEQLSGGNQQKVLISRWLHNDSEIFLLNEPTRGVDVNTIKKLHGLFVELAEEGKTLIIVSSEIAELTNLCNRILVMSNGKPAGIYSQEEWSYDDLLKAAFSEYAIHKSSLH